MTKFRVTAEIGCPSDWGVEKARAFVIRQMLSGKEEIESLRVTQIPDISEARHRQDEVDEMAHRHMKITGGGD